jgi:hypothetical protein
MVICVIDPAVIRIDQTLCSPARGSESVDIAFVIVPVRQDALIVSEAVSADAHAGCVVLEGSA